MLLKQSTAELDLQRQQTTMQLNVQPAALDDSLQPTAITTANATTTTTAMTNGTPHNNC